MKAKGVRKKRKAKTKRSPAARTQAASREQPFQNAQLEQIADLIERDSMSPYQRQQFANFLRGLARAKPKGRGRPKVGRARDWKMGLDYEVTSELLGNSKEAVYQVSQAWGVVPSVVMAAHKNWIEQEGQKRWAELERPQFTFDNPDLNPEQLLVEVSKTIRSQIKSTPEKSAN